MSEVTMALNKERRDASDIIMERAVLSSLAELTLIDGVKHEATPTQSTAMLYRVAFMPSPFQSFTEHLQKAGAREQ